MKQPPTRIDGTLAVLMLAAFVCLLYVLFSGMTENRWRADALLAAAFAGIGFGAALTTRMFESGRPGAAIGVVTGSLFMAVWTWLLLPTNAYQCQELIADWISRGWWH